MEKKSKKSGKRTLKAFVKGNNVFLAALGGAVHKEVDLNGSIFKRYEKWQE
jgi:hypothetical protein